MNQIEITEEQKKKLLEMCKALFSEYDKYTFWHSDFIGLYHVIDDEESAEDNVSIHWFEFCHCYIAPKLFIEYKEKLQFYIDTYTGNPIDYLYEEFKKLKK